MFSYSTGYYVSPPVDQYLKFKNRCSLVNTFCTATMSTEGVFAVCKNIILNFYTLNGKQK
jgi:hypothetical protein